MIDLTSTGEGLEGYGLLSAQLQSLLADERDFIANAAQFSAFLFSQLDDLNWAGFYLNRNDELVLGPFRARLPACGSRLAVACAVLPRRPARPSAWTMSMHSPGTSPATAHRTANWWCRWSRTGA